jgi:hypothetical protein
MREANPPQSVTEFTSRGHSLAAKSRSSQQRYISVLSIFVWQGRNGTVR